MRALAIVPVVLFHAFPSALPGGFVGVDVFFVISGYLITSLLLQRLESGRFSIVSFYGARVRRIFPALFVMLALVTPLAVWLLSPVGLQEFGRTLGATAVFFSNIELHRTTGYFDTVTELKPLVHTWSLAVEEQYYIVFLLLLAFMFKRWRSGITPVLLSVGLCSLALSIWWLRFEPALYFYSAFSRTFELMLGSLLALGFAGSRAPQIVRDLAAALGLSCIVLACMLLTPKTPFPGVAALLPCLGAGLLIWAGDGPGQTWAGRLVSFAPLRWIGAMSFSLYLWHWPVLVFTRHWLLDEPTMLQSTLAVGASVLLAWASLKWVEAPMRRSSASDRQLLAGGTTCIAVALVTAALLTGAGASLQALDPREEALYSGAEDINAARRQCHGRNGHPIPYRDRCQFGDSTSQTQVVVWADSHGAELALALGERLGGPGRSVAQITASSCPPALNFEPPLVLRCREHNQQTLSHLLSDARVDIVVLAARWRWYQGIDSLGFEAGMVQSVRALAQAGKRVVLVEPFPEYRYPVPAALGALSRRGQLRDDSLGQTIQGYLAANERSLAVIRQLAALPNVSVVSASAVFCPNGHCQVMSAGGMPYYFDDNHLSMTGARHLIRNADLLALQIPAPASGR
ncbi:MAG: acyltransferase [Burkholderiaceae bacterium]|nr:acyltransferase [Burkholderiaceae bacterium]